MDFRKSKVLVLEGNSLERDLLSMAVRRLGCQVVATSDGVEAMARIQAEAPDLLLLDIFLPRMNGLDLLHQLQDAGLLQKTMVVVVSSLGFQEVVQQAIEAGARDFIIKPIDTDLLVRRLERLLSPGQA